MSDVTVSVVESTTSVTVSNDVVDISVVENPVTIVTGNSGPQGASYNQGDPVYVTVRNSTGSTLAKGTIVYTSGGNGTHTQVSPALATSDATSARVLGWLAESIANNASGLCQVEGYLDGINTQGITEGTQLYLSGTTAGSFQTTKPQAPIHLVYVGVCVKASVGNGRVYVKVQNGYELDEIHDVQITSVADGDLLEYDSVTSLWKNVPQSVLTVAQSQVTGLVSALAAKANTASPTFTGTVTAPFTNSGLVQSNASGVLSVTAAPPGLGRIPYTAAVTGGYAWLDLNLVAQDNVANAFTVGGHTITNDAIGTIPLNITAIASQTANNIRVQNSALNTIFSVSAGGSIYGQTLSLASSFAGTQVLGIQPYNATTIPAIIRGATSQSANLLELQNDAGTILSRFTSTGQYQTSTVPAVGGLQSASGVGAYFAMNNDTGGIVTYTNGDANRGLIVRANSATQTSDLFQTQKSDGTLLFRLRPDTTNQAADIVNMNGPVQISPTAGGTGYGLFVKPGATGVVALLVRGLASQSGNLQEWQNSGSSVLASIDAFGQVRATSSLFGLNSSTNSVAITVRPVANQVADLLQFQTSTTSVVGGRNANAQIYTGSSITAFTAVGGTIQSIATGANPLITMASAHGLAVGDLVQIAGTTGNTYNGTNLIVSTVPSSTTFTIISGLTVGQASAAGTVAVAAQASVTARSAGTIPLIVQAASGQLANLQTWNSSSGGALARVSPTGQIATASNMAVGAVAITPTNMFQVTATAATQIGAVIRGAVSQSANLLQLQNDTASVTASFTAPVNNVSRLNLGGTDLGGTLGINVHAAGGVGQVIRGAASQSANLQEWQNSAGTVLARVLSDGAMFAPSFTNNNGRALIGENNAGGTLRLERATAAQTNPGANYARLYFRDGTVPGTLKLVVIAGAAGAETTILDNIPQ